jgi:hypothetical protein
LVSVPGSFPQSLRPSRSVVMNWDRYIQRPPLWLGLAAWGRRDARIRGPLEGTQIPFRFAGSAIFRPDHQEDVV